MLDVAKSAWVNRDAPVSLAQAAAIPFATLGVRLDEGRQQILILATDSNGERMWTSGTKVAIVTRHGRIIRTAGFGTDLSASNDGEREADWTHMHAYSWAADFVDLGVYSASVACTVNPVGAEPIVILDAQFDTIRVDETCQSDPLGWSYTNTYWVSPRTGRVWRATIHIHPKGPVLEIELLRPPATPD